MGVCTHPEHARGSVGLKICLSVSAILNCLIILNKEPHVNFALEPTNYIAGAGDNPRTGILQHFTGGCLTNDSNTQLMTEASPLDLVLKRSPGGQAGQAVSWEGPVMRAREHQLCSGKGRGLGGEVQAGVERWRAQNGGPPARAASPGSSGGAVRRRPRQGRWVLFCSTASVGSRLELAELMSRRWMPAEPCSKLPQCFMDKLSCRY